VVEEHIHVDVEGGQLPALGVGDDPVGQLQAAEKVTIASVVAVAV
jgi:hypothetical protein